MPTSLFLALRFLRDGRSQTLLIIIGVAVGVAVQVFIGALIDGLQTDLIDKTLGTVPHVVVTPEKEVARALFREDEGVAIGREVQPPSQRLRSVDQWPAVVERLRGMPGITTVSPRAAGPALVRNGQVTASIVIQGIRPASFDAIVPIEARLVAGEYRVAGEDVLVGDALAEELGVGVGDIIRVDTGGDNEGRFVVRGIFDLGGPASDSQWVLVSLRTAQTLLRVPGGATHIDLKVRDVFAADAMADQVARATGLPAESWMESNAQLLAALRSQSMSTTLIQVFVLLAVAMGIASVLVVSVVQKEGQIGILRAIGASRGAVLRVFFIQGAMMGCLGAIAGSGLGALLLYGFQAAMRATAGAPIFPIQYDPALFAGVCALAIVTGVAAAALPAIRASRLDPAVAIRHG